MTDPNETKNKLQKYRRLILFAASFSSSTIFFVTGCALTRYFTNVVRIQLVAGLITAVLFLSAILFLILTRRNRVAAANITLSDAAAGILMPFGMASLFFPRVCPEASEVLTQHIPPVVIDAIVICGAIALLVYAFLFMAKLVRQWEDPDS